MLRTLQNPAEPSRTLQNPAEPSRTLQTLSRLSADSQQRAFLISAPTFDMCEHTGSGAQEGGDIQHQRGTALYVWYEKEDSGEETRHLPGDM